MRFRIDSDGLALCDCYYFAHCKSELWQITTVHSASSFSLYPCLSLSLSRSCYSITCNGAQMLQLHMITIRRAGDMSLLCLWAFVIVISYLHWSAFFYAICLGVQFSSCICRSTFAILPFCRTQRVGHHQTDNSQTRAALSQPDDACKRWPWREGERTRLQINDSFTKRARMTSSYNSLSIRLYISFSLCCCSAVIAVLCTLIGFLLRALQATKKERPDKNHENEFTRNRNEQMLFNLGASILWGLHARIA